MTHFILVCSLFFYATFVQTLPFYTSGEEDSSSSSEESGENITRAVNGSGKDLIVIKTVVYEIGILTDDGNNTNAGSNETQEQVDVTFFNPSGNGTFIDLSNILLPFRTNVSGVSLTGVAPANFGTIKLLEDGTPTLNGSSLPVLPSTQVKISHNVNTIRKHKSDQILNSLADLLGLKINISSDNTTHSTTTASTIISTTGIEKTNESSSEIVA